MMSLYAQNGQEVENGTIWKFMIGMWVVSFQYKQKKQSTRAESSKKTYPLKIKIAVIIGIDYKIIQIYWSLDMWNQAWKKKYASIART